MSFYQKIGEFGSKYIGKDTLFKWGFNLFPMYRTSTARITTVSEDLMRVRIKLPISYRNKNYVGSIFGGSLFSSVDPIPMVQLINILDNEYIVWDKSAEVLFKVPAKEDLYAEFSYSDEEIEDIKAQVREHGEYEIIKTNTLTDKTGNKAFCEVRKTIYIASKEYFKQKNAARKNSDSQRLPKVA